MKNAHTSLILAGVLAGAMASAPALAASKPDFKVGGALWMNYSYKAWDSNSKNKKGDLGFDLFRLSVDGKKDNLLFSAQYRFYSYMNVLHHGWIGYQFKNKDTVKFGVTQVPFGILPYASHNYWFGVPFYLGLEDNYDAGVKYSHKAGPLAVDLAFFKNGEQGNAGSNQRYSFDVLTDSKQNQFNEKTNQFNGRVAYTLQQGTASHTELGLSGQWGQLYNSSTQSNGSHWAAGAHLNGKYGPFGLQLEAVSYKYSPNNPAGVSNDSVLMGAFATSYDVASKGKVYVANLSYDVPVGDSGLDSLTCYNDYSVLQKDKAGYRKSELNTVGCNMGKGPLFVYVDLIMGRNMPFLNGGSLAGGGSTAGWQNRFNVNVEYYF